jgi:hypothetical protein
MERQVFTVPIRSPSRQHCVNGEARIGYPRKVGLLNRGERHLSANVHILAQVVFDNPSIHEPSQGAVQIADPHQVPVFVNFEDKAPLRGSSAFSNTADSTPMGSQFL